MSRYVVLLTIFERNVEVAVSATDEAQAVRKARSKMSLPEDARAVVVSRV